MSAPSCRPRLVSAMSSVRAAATASSKNSSKKSPIRKNNRQPGFASLISRYWAITGEGAGGEYSFIGEGGRLRVFDGSMGSARARKRGSAWPRVRRLFRSFARRWPRFPTASTSTAPRQAGAALLWVRCEDSQRELTATRILEEAGGRHVHVHGRPPQTAGRST